MGKHVLTSTNITANPMNMSNSVAEYACVDIQCIGNSTNKMEAEINRSIYERLQIQSQDQKYTKQASQTSPNISNNNTAKCKTAKQHPSAHPPSYNLGNYFPRVSSEPTARKTYQTSSRERDLKVKHARPTIQQFSLILNKIGIFFYPCPTLIARNNLHNLRDNTQVEGF